MQADPIGFAGGDSNLYRYVENNPINFIDPNGLWRNPSQVFDQASQEARNLFSRRSLHNGKGDAYRHCLASCEMARENGQIVSEILGWANEVRGNLTHNQEIGENLMDNFNNAYGRKCATNADGFQDCSKRCLEATAQGDLGTYESGTSRGYLY
jgi:uncharacterized protein RhaS with RHS repeats